MNDAARQRVFVLRVLVVSLVLTLLGRLWYVQVLSGPTYRAQAASNATRQLVTTAPRGEIVDDEGRVLADDTYEYVVDVDHDTLAAEKGGGVAVLRRLSPIVGESVVDLQDKIRLCGDKTKGGTVIKQPCYTGSPYEPIPVKAFSPTDAAALTKALVVVERSELFPGVSISEQQVRQYPYGSVAGQELGYLNRISAVQLTQARYKGYQPTDLVGQTGLEDQYDAELRGTDSVKTVSVDATGKVTGTISQTQPVAGDTLVTNIDAGLQQAVETELTAGIAKAEAKGGYASTGAAVVMNVKTGAVLALASLPDYDPNEFTGGISTASYAALSDPNASAPLISRAMSANFPPGSTFKIASSGAILQNGLATPSTAVNCPGSYTPPGSNQAFGNFEGETKGVINLTQAIEFSCDTYFYQFAYDAWVRDGGPRRTTQQLAQPDQQLFYKNAEGYGYGSATGIDLPDEFSGVLFDRQKLAAAVAGEHKQECLGAHSHPTDPARELADAKLCATDLAEDQVLQAGDALDFAIGQGGEVDVTLLQQAVAYAAIANGGTRVVPQVAKAFVAADGKITTVKPRTQGTIGVSAANIQAIQAGLLAVVTGGTAAGAGFAPQLDVAGKTGTADVASTGLLADQPESWFASYQPASDPKYVVVVMIEHGGQGAEAAAPTVAGIYDDMYGLAGHRAVFPGGVVPAALPKIAATGVITPPQRGIIPVSRQPGLPGGTPVITSAQGVVTVGRREG